MLKPLAPAGGIFLPQNRWPLGPASARISSDRFKESTISAGTQPVSLPPDLQDVLPREHYVAIYDEQWGF